MKKLAFALMAVSFFVSIPSFAKEKGQKAWGNPAAVKPAKQDRPAKLAEPVALQDLNLTGRISKSEKTDKNGKTTTSYVLIDSRGKEISLPVPDAAKAKKGEATAQAINLDVYVDKTVTIVAKGTEKTAKTGAKSVHVKEIVSVSVAGLDTAPAVAPAAPAPDTAPAVAPAAPAPDTAPAVAPAAPAPAPAQ